jgi:hypothetical protein
MRTWVFSVASCRANPANRADGVVESMHSRIRLKSVLTWYSVAEFIIGSSTRPKPELQAFYRFFPFTCTWRKQREQLNSHPPMTIARRSAIFRRISELR